MHCLALDRQPTILVAEDNVADIYLLREALHEHSVECGLLIFEEGASALAFILNSARGSLAQERPDLFILDLNLPKVDGRSLLQNLRTLPEFKHAPVIVWTSSTSARDRQESKRLGATAHFDKPSNLDAFMTIGAIVKSMLEDIVAAAIAAQGRAEK